MTNMQPIPNDAVLIAIDVAEVRNEVLIEAANHRRRRRLTVLNNRIEHDRFIATLAGYNRPVICAFETTGNYHRPLAWRPTEAGFEARLLSSMALVRTREAGRQGALRHVVRAIAWRPAQLLASRSVGELFVSPSRQG
jgi:hypothetical protein